MKHFSPGRATHAQMVAQVCFSAMLVVSLHVTQAKAQGTPVAPVSNPCPRYNPGIVVRNPPALFSSNGALNVRFSFQHRFDGNGNEILCFMTPSGLEDPTLHVKPGDHLLITVTNNTPTSAAMPPLLNPPNCGDAQMTHSSINIHYHGTNTSPACHQDNSIKTVINPGQTFNYDVAIPSDEPSGLYWYHPHIHMLAEHQTQGGATGALIVDGIQNQQPAVSGLRERIFVVRDQPVPGNPTPVGNIPSFDLTVNYIVVQSPTSPTATNFVPPVLAMQPGTNEFWRVTNSAADTILDLQYVFDGVPQTMQLVAVDAVPLGSQDTTGAGSLIDATHFTLPPASRVEFIVPAPPSSVHLAQLITQRVYGGPVSIYNQPMRPIVNVHLAENEPESSSVHTIGNFSGMSTTQKRFAALASAPITAQRTLYFNFTPSPLQFFMVVQGRPQHVFDPNAPPDIVTTQGSVEEWTVENHTGENHEFHIHQIHFLVESQNNFEINGHPQAPAITGQYLDTIQVPFWDQNPNHPFPSVTLRMDFRGNIVGDFPFHCHILSHEDLGMMNYMRVLPAGQASAPNGPKQFVAEKSPRSNRASSVSNSSDAPLSTQRSAAKQEK